MSSLQQQLEAKRAAEPVTPSCYSGGTRSGGAFIEFRPDAHLRLGFPWAQLCYYTLEANGGDTDAPERLTLAFSTADVVLVGARPAKLFELLNEDDLASVSVVDARHAAGLLARAPWVASIAIARLDKPSGATG
jgi:hypothetical protein